MALEYNHNTVAVFWNVIIKSKQLRSILFFLLSALTVSYAAQENPAVSKKSEFRIAIFREENFPYIGVPDALTAERLYDILSTDFSVTYLDVAKLSDREYLNTLNFELLILPYGEAFPYKSFAQIKEFLFDGGGILNIAGRPFWIAMEKIGARWQKMYIDDPYEEFLSPLGIRYYEFFDKPNIGISVTTSLGITPVEPTFGNVFPYRIPVRDFSFLEDTENKKYAQSVILVKSWRNPYKKNSKNIPRKWCFIGAKGEGHPLNPQNSPPEETLLRIIDYLSFPVILYELNTDFAAYYQKERVRVSVNAMNSGETEKKCVVQFDFFDKDGNSIHKETKSITLGSGQDLVINGIWRPKYFKSNFYKVTATLKGKDEGRVLDREENGFVIIDQKVLESGPSLKIKGDKFFINEKPAYIFGVNYYEGKLGELMWLRPNILKIKEDFKSMRDLGINFIRIHYHHSKWFRDYFSKVVKEELDPYLRIADTRALPSKRSLRILDAVIQLAQEQGLVFCMDIFSLVPEEMGDPIGWLGLKERIMDRDKILFQKKFVNLIANRYKEIPGITWDLWNEPSLKKDNLELLRDWLEQIKEAFRRNGDTHSITLGDNLSLYLLDVLDYGCVHTYEPGEFKFKDLSKPVIFQEVWNASGSGLDEELKQAEELEKDFNAFLKTGAAGFIPWQWTRQARLWNNFSKEERWDDELGTCVNDDSTLKLAGKTYRDLIALTK
jgi:hypothetical protein